MNLDIDELREEMEEELKLCIEMLIFNDGEEEYNALSKSIIDKVFGQNILINYIEIFKRTVKGDIQKRSREQRNKDIEEVFVISLKNEFNSLNIEKLKELETLFNTELREEFIF